MSWSKYADWQRKITNLLDVKRSRDKKTKGSYDSHSSAKLKKITLVMSFKYTPATQSTLCSIFFNVCISHAPFKVQLRRIEKNKTPKNKKTKQKKKPNKNKNAVYDSDIPVTLK